MLVFFGILNVLIALEEIDILSILASRPTTGGVNHDR
jgi:hypothetical protein